MNKKEIEAMALLATMSEEWWKKAKLTTQHANRVYNEITPGQKQRLSSLSAWLNVRTKEERANLKSILLQAGAVIEGGEGREQKTIFFPKR